jgi:microcystin-dependent protein
MNRKQLLSSTAAVAGLGLMSLAPASWQPTQSVQAYGINAVPPGSILPFGGDVIPPGYLLCDGTEVLRSDYPRLYTAIGESWGATTTFTFTLPDLRGLFLRGVDGTANNDPNHSSRTAINLGGNTGNMVGSFQLDGRKGFSGNFNGSTSTSGAHNHTFPTYNDDYDEDDGSSSQHNPGWADDRPSPPSAQLNSVSSSGAHNHSFSVSVNFSGEPETRPKNAYVNYVIKW